MQDSCSCGQSLKALSLSLRLNKPWREEHKFQKLETSTIKSTSHVTALCLPCARSKQTVTLPGPKVNSWVMIHSPITITTTTTAKESCGAWMPQSTWLVGGQFQSRKQRAATKSIQYFQGCKLQNVVMLQMSQWYKFQFCHCSPNKQLQDCVMSVVLHDAYFHVSEHSCSLEVCLPMGTYSNLMSYPSASLSQHEHA